MADRNGKKTGGKVKGSKNKMTLAEAAVKEKLNESNDPLRLLLDWIKELALKFLNGTIDDDEKKIYAELLKMALPYTNRKMPTAIEADVKSEMTVILQSGDDDL